ncbi:MAG: class I SAM-dependent methyltransferase [Candidatus Cloacimonadaceae bacterium]
MKDYDKQEVTSAADKEAKTSQPVVYDFFAPYYDYHMRHVDYNHWARKFLSLYWHFLHSQPQDILELACGTGNISELLVAMGYKVTGTDRSAGMLKCASQKQFKPILKQAEMTQIEEENAYDLILTAFDSINYLVKDEDIKRLFTAVAKALRPHGLFIFDISTHKNSVENFSDYLNLDETEDYTLIHKARYEIERHLQKTDIIVFQREGEHYVRFEEKHVQRVYFVPEILNLFASSPLECIGVFNMISDRNLLNDNVNKLDYQFCRLFLVCCRRNNAA